MYSVKKSIATLYIFIILTNFVSAKSLYVIQNFREAPQIYTYDINGFNLDRVAEGDYTTSNAYPIGLAVHESDYGQWMFCTIEYTWYGTNIERINLQTGESEKTISVENASGDRGMAGIVIDKYKNKLYTMDRWTNHLWSYSWNPLNQILTLDFNYPYYVELTDLAHSIDHTVGAFGIALDEENDLLYVSDNTTTIKYYDTSDWSYEGGLEVDCNAISIAVDKNRHKIYYGSIGEGYGDGDPCLYQYNLLTNENNSIYIGNAAVGIAVDQDTGLVYVTTGQETTLNEKYKLMTYDANLIQHGTPIQLGCPTSLTVADVGYRHPYFEIIKDANGADYVEPLISEMEHTWMGTPYNWLYYNINWDANGFADSNVVITDILPLEVNEPNYISNGGEYDADLHVVRWNIGNVSAEDSNQFKIQTAVNYYARPCGTIRNIAVIQGDHYHDKYIIDTNVGDYGGDIIYVDKDANGFENGTTWKDAYKDLQTALEYARSSCATVVNIWVANGVYKSVDNVLEEDYQNKSFELVENVGLFGHFRGGEESLDERDFADANNETILDGIIGNESSQQVYNVVKAENIEYPDYTIIDGFTIKNAGNNGLYTDDSYVGILNCKFQDNSESGVCSTNFSYPDVHNCTFFNNGTYGLKAMLSSRPVISYSVFDGNDRATAGVYLRDYTVAEVNNCIFKNNITGATAQASSLTAEDSNFVDNSDGINLGYGTNILSNCHIENSSDYGMRCSGASNVTLSGCSIENSGCGIFSSGYSDVNLSECSITHSRDNGISCSSSHVILTDCIVQNSGSVGMYCSESDLTMEHSIISLSDSIGLYMTNGCDLVFKGNVVRNNGEEGLSLNSNLTSTITNNWIYNNGTAEDSYANGCGIYLYNHTWSPLIRNNTIYGNFTYGIQMSHNGGEPNISNCIIYGNDANDLYREDANFSNVKYCCLHYARTGTGNIAADPCFVDADSDDLHIAKNSRCRNAGNPYGDYSNETDIDGDVRVKYDRVDIGADESYFSFADYDDSDIVDFSDYRYLAQDWRVSQSNYSLDDDNDIDVQDLALFCVDWLCQNDAENSWMLSAGETESLQLMSLSVSLSSVEDSETEVSSIDNETSLMLTTAAESKLKQPARLAAKSKKFYGIRPPNTITDKQRELESLKIQRIERMSKKDVSINSILNWLDDLWQNDEEIRNSMDANDWQEFVESVKYSE